MSVIVFSEDQLGTVAAVAAVETAQTAHFLSETIGRYAREMARYSEHNAAAFDGGSGHSFEAIAESAERQVKANHWHASPAMIREAIQTVMRLRYNLEGQPHVDALEAILAVVGPVMRMALRNAERDR